MPVWLPDTFKEQIEKAHGMDPLVWLYELDALVQPAPLPSTVFRFAASQRDIWWGGHQFFAFPVALGGLEIDPDQMPRVTLTIDNSTRLVRRYVRDMVGNDVRIYLVDSADLNPAKVVQEQLQIAGWAANRSVLTLRLEPPRYLQRLSPMDRFHPHVCDAQFGRAETGCPYIVNGAAAYQRCGNVLPDCRLRGQDQAARNLPVTLPRMFNGEPGVAIRRSA